MNVWVEGESVAFLLLAFLRRRRVRVTTATREFEGSVEGVYHSPFAELVRGTVVDDEGRVHNFYPERGDCDVEFA